PILERLRRRQADHRGRIYPGCVEDLDEIDRGRHPAFRWLEKLRSVLTDSPCVTPDSGCADSVPGSQRKCGRPTALGGVPSRRERLAVRDRLPVISSATAE